MERAGNIWEFKKVVDGTQFYIKVKIVQENFDILLGKMTADHIAHIEVIYDNGYEKHQVIPECITSRIPVF